MRKLFPGLFFGLVLVGIGAIFLLNSLGFTAISFDGWWTLFIIVPCISSVISNRPNAWNVGGLLLGLWLLSREQGWLPEQFDGKFTLGFIAIIVGLMLILGAVFRKHPTYTPNTHHAGTNDLSYTVVFGGQEINHTALINGGTLTAVFGGIELDLRQATVTDGAVIDVTTFCGGIEIKPPPGVRILVTGTPIFGGYDNKAEQPIAPDAPTLRFNITAVFGGIEIKRA